MNFSIHLQWNCNKSRGIHYLINALIFGLFIYFIFHAYNVINCYYFYPLLLRQKHKLLLGAIFYTKIIFHSYQCMEYNFVMTTQLFFYVIFVGLIPIYL